MEIKFSTCAFVNYPQPMYDPDVVDLFRRGPRPGTLLRGIVIKVTDNRGILLKQTSGFQRGCKRWEPFARMWTLTGEQFAVPNPRYLRWYDEDLEADWRAQRRADERNRLA
jgi:hypothetical protein